MEELQHAYEMGRNANFNKPDEVNCDFRIFSSPAKTRAWERGRDEALKEKEKELLRKKPLTPNP